MRAIAILLAALLPCAAAAQSLSDALTGGHSPVASRYQWGSTGGDFPASGLTVLSDCDGDALHSETACRVGDAWTVTGAPTLVASYWRPAGGSLQANAIRLAGGDSVASPTLTYGSYCVRGATAAGVADVTCYTGGSGAITLSARDVQRVIVFSESLTAGQITAIQNASFAKQGSLGEPLTVTRASSKSCSIGGAWYTVPSGQPCIGDAGLSVEGQRTQYALNNCTTPADQTVTLAAGAHTLWLEGTGTVAAAVGTVTATGLPCTATSASACSFTVSVGGTVTLDATGTVTAMQVENGARSSLICATTTPVTRQADSDNAPHGIAGNRWCVRGTYDPTGDWRRGADYDLWVIGTGANSARLVATYTNLLVFGVTDATNTDSYLYKALPAGSAAMTITACSDAGTLNLYYSNILQSVARDGAGTGTTASLASALSVGMSSIGTLQFGGTISGVTTCNTSVPGDCQ